MKPTNILTAYFSASGTTAKAAKILSQATQADLYEIKPAVPYTRADLDWTNQKSRSSVEMNDRSARPAIADRISNMADYDTIYLCFPIWWYTAPAIIKTFLESYDFSGKTIVLFATSGGSSLGSTAKTLQALCPGAAVKDGKLLNGHQTAESLAAWVNK